MSSSRQRIDYALKDLKTKFCFKPLVKRRALVVSSEGIGPSTKFDSMRKSAKAIGIGEGSLGMQGAMGEILKEIQG